MPRVQPILMLLLLLGAIPEATAETTQDVQALSVLGGVRVKSELGLWILPSGEGGGTFVLEAGRLTSTYDENWLMGPFLVDRPGRLYFRNQTPEPGNTHSEVNITLNGNAWMDDGFLAITPIEGRPPPQLAFAADSLVAEVEPRPCASDPGPMVMTTCWETGSAGRIAATRPTAPVTLSGDFRMRIWGWEGGGSIDGRYRGVFWTGTAPSEAGAW